MCLEQEELIMKNGVGLKTIAMELNLSITAVSRALKDCDDISDKMKELVREKAIELNYVPLDMSKNLKKGPTKTIAVIVDSLKSPFFGMINELLIGELKNIGYRVIIIPTNSLIACKDNIKEALELRVDGIISFLIPNKDAYDIARLNKVPLLLFGRLCDLEKMHCIVMNDYMGGQLACDYLVKQRKCNKLCYVGSSSIECNERRKNGFFDRARELNIDDCKYIEATDKYDQLLDLVEKGYKGFFFFDDQLASFIIKYQNEYDISIVGFNGVSRFYEYAYNITSIEADYSLMAKEAVDLLISQINNYDDNKKIIKMFDTNLYLGNT